MTIYFQKTVAWTLEDSLARRNKNRGSYLHESPSMISVKSGGQKSFKAASACLFELPATGVLSRHSTFCNHYFAVGMNLPIAEC